MEKMWLTLSVVTFLIAIYRSFQESVFDALYFYAFSAIAILLFLMRRKQRLFHEKNQNRKDD